MTGSKQAVADNTNAQAKPGSEAAVGAQDNGGDDLDQLLAEFPGDSDGSSQTSEQQPVARKATETKPDKQPGELYDAVQTLLERDAERQRDEQRRQFEVDMSKTIGAVRGSIPADQASDRLVRAWIEGMAEENPRLATAWANRHKEPKAFARIVEKLGREFANEFAKRPDPNVTEDREAVAAAVRSASTKAPEERPPDYKSMTDSEFASDVEKKFGFRPF